MLWNTLRSVMLSTRCEYTPVLAAAHCFVQLPSGKWTRVLGAPPRDAVHVRGRVYRLKA